MHALNITKFFPAVKQRGSVKGLHHEVSEQSLEAG